MISSLPVALLFSSLLPAAHAQPQPQLQLQPQPQLQSQPQPQLSLSWKRDQALLSVVVPAGEHIAPDAPVHAVIDQGTRHGEWSLTGTDLATGLQLAALSGRVTAQLRLSLCQDAGTTCRLVDVAGAGSLEGKRGAVLLAAQAPVAQPVRHAIPDPADTFAADPDAAVLDAQARAQATGGRVLLDFGAVWCPPCNMLSAEVLHAEDAAAQLDGLVLVTVDADRSDSWTLKDAYAVGGYPTLVATDASGREVARLLGYPGRAQTVEWLSAVRDGLDLTTLVDDQPSPKMALGLAVAFARQGQEDQARQALDVALHDPTLADRPEVYRTRFLLDHDSDDLAWLLSHDVDQVQPAMDWIFDALGVVQDAEDPLSGDLKDAVAVLLVQADASQQADLLWLLGELADEGPDRRALRGAAAAALSHALSGDLDKDRGYLGFQAELLADAGELDAAVAVLNQAIDAWPDDFTFHNALARTLHHADASADALAPAQAALACAYGDNRLRAARSLAQILGELDRIDEGRAVISDALAQAKQPAEGLDVRTPRYLDALHKLDAQLAEQAASGE